MPDNKRRNVTKWAICAVVVLAAQTGAFALNPSLDINQYAHTAWKIRDGFPKATIMSIAQTPDGYLWLGSELGLFRFDGVRAVPWRPPAGEQLPSNWIPLLVAARDGTLWIGTLKGLASWKDGKLTQYPELAGMAILALLEDREGTVWIGTGYRTGKLCAVHGRSLQCYGAGSFGLWVTALYEDHEGNLWVSAQTGLWRWAPGPPERHMLPRAVIEVTAMAEGDATPLLLATNDGLKQVVGGTIQGYALAGIAGQFIPNRLCRGGDGSLWVGSRQGLLHLRQRRIDRFTAADGLSGNRTGTISKDREGDVWVATSEGLDRFRDFAVATISLKEGLSSSTANSVQATPDGSIWIGTPDGLYRWERGHMTVYGRQKPQSLGIDDKGRLWAATVEGVFQVENGRFVPVPGVPGGQTYSVAADRDGNVWISNAELGVFCVTPEHGVQHIPWARVEPRYGGRALLPDGSGLWVGFYDGGVAYIKDGHVQVSFNPGNGLGPRHCQRP